MAINNWPVATKNENLDNSLDKADAGTDPGVLVAYTDSGMLTEVATLTLSNPAFAAASTTKVAYGVTSDTNATGGTIAWAAIEDSDGNLVHDGDATVTGGGGAYTFDVLVVPAGGIVNCTQMVGANV